MQGKAILAFMLFSLTGLGMALAQTGGEDTVSGPVIWVWFHKGGILMYPILLCSLLGVAITLERFFALQRHKIIPPPFLRDLRAHWERGEIDAVLRLCRQYETPLTRILEAGFRRSDLGVLEVERAIEAAGQHEVSLLTANLRMLGAIGGISPMLGLLGTVTGMIKAFDVIAQSGTGNPSLVASGIAEALITTAAGLIVGIPSLAAYHFFRGRVDRLVYEMEEIATELLAGLPAIRPAEGRSTVMSSEKESPPTEEAPDAFPEDG
ncbi:MAG: MotA/TolQ/ExbB proton channel family protein [Nitrospinota bacterium]|nr:MAG: MotA/TolQ/ExbB proton channel family protein [Nitrospinota bacterium]